MRRVKKYISFLDKATYYLEAAITFFLLIVIVALFAELILAQCGISITIVDTNFETILSDVFMMVIGVEFAKMLCKHTPEAVIEVLLFAVARQMLLAHSNMTNLMIGVAAIAGLFAVKKYLFPIRSDT